VSPHPALTRALAAERAAELGHVRRPIPTTRSQARPLRTVQAARRGAGWLLVDVGLRLALPGGSLKRPVARLHR